MATTAVTKGQNVLSIATILTNSWLWTDSLPGRTHGIRVHSIVVMAAAADTFVLREGSTTGAIWFAITTSGAATNTYPIGGVLLRPVLAIGDQTCNAGSIYTIVYERA